MTTPCHASPRRLTCRYFLPCPPSYYSTDCGEKRLSVSVLRGLSVGLPSVISAAAPSCLYPQRMVRYSTASVVYPSPTLIYAIDANTISNFLSRNRETLKDFVKFMSDDCKRKVQDLHKENNDLRNENKELQNSIEFSHNQTNDLKNVSTSFRVN